MLYKYHELLEKYKKIETPSFKVGDYVQISPNIDISIIYKKILDIYKDEDRVFKININTLFRIEYIFQNTEIVVAPILDPNDTYILFAIPPKYVIPAEEYKVNVLKYNL
jgi:hypothetical protein